MNLNIVTKYTAKVLKDVRSSQGLYINFLHFEICKKGDENTPEYEEKNGGHGPSLASRDPGRFALLCKYAFFLAHSFILLYFSCSFELMKGKRKITLTFWNFPVII